MTRILPTLLTLLVVPATGLFAGPKVVLETTLGNITLELNEEKAPLSVANFLKHVDAGNYNGVVFHRVIENFMVQTGGFAVNEDGSIAQRETEGTVKNEADNGLSNVRGSIAMARTPDPDSASAQFFINLKDNDFLNHTAPTREGWGYAVFGEVIEGMEVVDKIAEQPTQVRQLLTRSPAGLSPVPMQNVPSENIVVTSAKRVEAEAE